MMMKKILFYEYFFINNYISLISDCIFFCDIFRWNIHVFYKYKLGNNIYHGQIIILVNTNILFLEDLFNLHLSNEICPMWMTGKMIESWSSRVSHKWHNCA